MKVSKIYHINNKPGVVLDCFVGDGYLQGGKPNMPDVDCDFESAKRQDVKNYIERRYNHDGKQRVFSAGTLTTLKIKAVIKDVARTMKIPPSLVNYYTAIIDDKSDFSEIFRQGAKNRKIGKFISDYPQLFEDIRTLMFQPRSSSVHASALLVTPDFKDGEDVECFDFVPIKKVDGILVSDNDGYELDELGLLKNDCLATKELSKLHECFDLCKQAYNVDVSLEGIVTKDMDDPEVFRIISGGNTQNVFQFSSAGMTKFLISMQPTCFNDLVAANALYRPATLENGALDAYVNCKHGLISPVYLWGTYNALKDTYGQIIYQEQVSLIAREVGNFSLGEGVNLVKAVSKKKVDKIHKMHDKFMAGAAKNNCPEDDAKAIWNQIEACGSYLFNRSHATAYAATAYAGAYLKVHYPTVFYTVALEWADDDEIASIISEMQLCSKARVVSPDINFSSEKFYTDYETHSIFWSLNRIKQVGSKAVEWIVTERGKHGDFTGVVNFIDRVFKYKLKRYQYWDDPDNEEEAQRCPVNARHILNLIFAGCFDRCECIESTPERYQLVQKASEHLGFQVKPTDIPEDMKDKDWWWEQQQIKVSGIGAIDYKRIFKNSEIKAAMKGRASYFDLNEIAPLDMEGRRVIVCATVVDSVERQFKSKKTGEKQSFLVLTLQQNNDLCECVVWPEEYAEFRTLLSGSKGHIVIFNAVVKYSDYSGKNAVQFTKKTLLEVL